MYIITAELLKPKESTYIEESIKVSKDESGHRLTN